MSENMDRMQQDAMRRMHEMQARAKGQQTRMGNARPGPGHVNTPPPLPKEAPPVPDMPEKPLHTKHEKTGPAKDLLAGLFEDKERSLILLLILLLSSENNTDSGLVLALMYLII